MKDHTLTIRHYNEDLTFARTSMSNIPMEKGQACTAARGILEMEDLFGASDFMKPVTACNISVRGPNGKFVSWKK